MGSVREQRRSAGELGPDQVVLQATNQLGAKYEPPLAVGDRLRLFARTNARCTDGLRGQHFTVYACRFTLCR